MPETGNNTFPAIQDVTNLVRSWIQDDMAGATGTLGEGQIFPDNPALSVTMMNCFNSALRIVCRKLRTSTGPMLIFDNVILAAVPPLVSPTQGASSPDPSVQVNISKVGYFNGTTTVGTPILPANLLMVERLWERVTGSNDNFAPMSQPAQGLGSAYQNVYNGSWEWRQNQINMPGSIETMDLRMRYQGTIPALFLVGIDTASTYIPIDDCNETLAAYTLQQLGMRQGAQMLPGAMQWANDQIADFLNEQIKRDQGIPYPVYSFGDCDVDSGQGAGQR